MVRQACYLFSLSFLAFESLAAQTPSPAATLQQEITRVVGGQGLERGLERFDSIVAGRPEAVAQSAINAFGYALLRGDRAGDAFRVFQFAVARYPTSANLHDSYAEVALANRDTAAALRGYRRVLALSAADASLNPGQRNDLTRRAAAFVTFMEVQPWLARAPGVYAAGSDTVIVALRDFVLGAQRTQDLLFFRIATGEYGKLSVGDAGRFTQLAGLEGAALERRVQFDSSSTTMRMTVSERGTASTYVQIPMVSQRPVRFAGVDGELCGVITLPANARGGTGVVWVHGSGSGGRYYLLHDLLARWFALRGITSLNYDKRGSGCSGGTPFDQITLADLAADAQSALEFLAASGDVDPARTGFIGRSQGGWISPIAIQRGAPARFLALIGGPATTSWEQELDRIRESMLAEGFPADTAERAVRLMQEVYAVVEGRQTQAGIDSALALTRAASWRTFVNTATRPGDIAARLRIRHDPAPAIGSLRIPVLLLYGEDDNLVPPARNIPLWRQFAPNATLEVKTYPGMDHALVRSTPSRSRIGFSADSPRIGIEAYRDMVIWLVARTG